MTNPNDKMIMTLIGDAVLKTALIANELNIQTKGEMMIPEEDYGVYVQNFQIQISKRIMPVRTMTDLKEEAGKFVKQILEAQQGKNNDSEVATGNQHGTEGTVSEDKA